MIEGYLADYLDIKEYVLKSITVDLEVLCVIEYFKSEEQPGQKFEYIIGGFPLSIPIKKFVVAPDCGAEIKYQFQLENGSGLPRANFDVMEGGTDNAATLAFQSNENDLK